MLARILFGGTVGVNLSIKNVPDEIAAALRERAARNHRSLQGELMRLVEAAVREERGHGHPEPGGEPAVRGGAGISIEEAAERARRLFPQGTESSVDYIRGLRDHA